MRELTDKDLACFPIMARMYERWENGHEPTPDELREAVKALRAWARATGGRPRQVEYARKFAEAADLYVRLPTWDPRGYNAVQDFVYDWAARRRA